MTVQRNRNHLLKHDVRLANDAYVVSKRHAEGGLGIIYEAYSCSLEREVALKEFYPPDCRRQSMQRNGKSTLPEGIQGSENPHWVIPDCPKEKWEKRVSEFLKEATILNDLQGRKGIPSYHGKFADNNTAYIVLQLFSGDTLGETTRSHRLTIVEIIDYIIQVGEILDIAHDQNILHLDVQPSNIMITRDRQAFLIDFGSARYIDEDQPIGLHVHATKDFGAPEIVNRMRDTTRRGQHYFQPSRNSDVYSLAATCYYLLTGDLYPKYNRGAKLSAEENLRVWLRLKEAGASPFEEVLKNGLVYNPMERSNLRQFLDGTWETRNALAKEHQSRRSRSYLSRNDNSYLTTTPLIVRTTDINLRQERKAVRSVKLPEAKPEGDNRLVLLGNVATFSLLLIALGTTLLFGTDWFQTALRSGNPTTVPGATTFPTAHLPTPTIFESPAVPAATMGIIAAPNAQGSEAPLAWIALSVIMTLLVGVVVYMIVGYFKNRPSMTGLRLVPVAEGQPEAEIVPIILSGHKCKVPLQGLELEMKATLPLGEPDVLVYDSFGRMTINNIPYEDGKSVSLRQGDKLRVDDTEYVLVNEK
jgi:serine/threonine protein kinase